MIARTVVKIELVVMTDFPTEPSIKLVDLKNKVINEVGEIVRRLSIAQHVEGGSNILGITFGPPSIDKISLELP